MKTVFSNEMTIHVWAQQSQAQGRSSHGSLSFSGPTLYSYSTPIANFVKHEGSERVVLITNRTYSVTTSGKHMPSNNVFSSNTKKFSVKHLGVTGGQAPNYPYPKGKFVENMKYVHKANLDDMADKYNELLTRVSKARSNAEWLTTQLGNHKRDAIDYATFFKVKFDADKHMPDVSPEVLQHAKDASNKASQAKAKQTKERKAQIKIATAKALKEYLDCESALPYNWFYNATNDQRAIAEAHKPIFDGKIIDMWRNGEMVQLHGLGHDETMLRIKGDLIQTSRGAEFPIKHAKLAFKVIKKCIDNKQDWHTNGHKIPLGHFQIDTIAPNGDVIAGCHTVKYAEIETIAKQLGLI